MSSSLEQRDKDLNHYFLCFFFLQLTVLKTLPILFYFIFCWVLRRSYMATFQLYCWRKTSAVPPLFQHERACPSIISARAGTLWVEPQVSWITFSHEWIQNPWRDTNQQLRGTSDSIILFYYVKAIYYFFCEKIK